MAILRGIGVAIALAPCVALAHDPTTQVVALEAKRAAPAFSEWVLLGVEHIVVGTDHLLFLAAIALVSTRLRDLAGAITAFTVAHSITLALAALEIVWIPSSIVEPAIAASIVFVAVENVARKDPLRGRPALTFAFGLIHGFGFASVLAEAGIASGATVPALAGFNLGVEVGQLAIVATAILPLGLARRKAWFHRLAIPGASAAIGFAGAYWFTERVLGGA